MHGGLCLDHSYFRPWLDPLGAFAELIYDDHRGNDLSSRTASLAGLILCSTASARGEIFGRPMESDDDLRAIWLRVLPLYFRRYEEKIGQAIDQATAYSTSAWNHRNTNCLPAFNTVARLAEITAPTLVIRDADDWITAPAQGLRRVLGRGFPGASNCGKVSRKKKRRAARPFLGRVARRWFPEGVYSCSRNCTLPPCHTCAVRHG